jgi:hypothetical protein
VRDTAVYRLVMQTVRLAEEKLPRDDVATLLGARLVSLKMGERPVRGAKLAAFVREALSESATPAQWDSCFFAIVAGRAESRRADASAVATVLLSLRDRVLALPERAPLVGHVAALRAIIDALGIYAQVHRQGRAPVPDPSRAQGRAQGDEQAALRMLDDTLTTLVLAARHTRLHELVPRCAWAVRAVQR